MSDPRPETDDDQVVIAIVRSGGLAGVARTWKIEPAPDEAPKWLTLVDRCPWDDPDEKDPGADRFVWNILVRTPSQLREREVADSHLSGPWQKLVDAVRAEQKRRKEERDENDDPDD